jgi:hypothetical protein
VGGCGVSVASSERGMSCARCDEWGAGVDLSCSEGSMPRCSCEVVSFYFPQQKRIIFFCAVSFMIYRDLTSPEALGCE